MEQETGVDEGFQEGNLIAQIHVVQKMGFSIELGITEADGFHMSLPGIPPSKLGGEEPHPTLPGGPEGRDFSTKRHLQE